MVEIRESEVKYDVDSDGNFMAAEGFSINMWVKAEVPIHMGEMIVTSQCWLCDTTIMVVKNKIQECHKCHVFNYEKSSDGKWRHVTMRFDGSKSS